MPNDLALPAAHRAIELVADGMSLTGALEIVGLSAGTFNRRCDSDAQLAAGYARATRLRADLHVDQMVDIADTDPNPARARNRIDARKYAASKMNPSKYSDRLDITVSERIDLNAALTEAKARLRPVSDQPDNVTDLTLDDSGTYTAGATDKQSDAAAPDIFD